MKKVNSNVKKVIASGLIVSLLTPSLGNTNCFASRPSDAKVLYANREVVNKPVESSILTAQPEKQRKPQRISVLDSKGNVVPRPKVERTFNEAKPQRAKTAKVEYVTEKRSKKQIAKTAGKVLLAAAAVGATGYLIYKMAGARKTGEIAPYGEGNSVTSGDVAPYTAESNAMTGEIAPYVAGNNVTSGDVAPYVAENGTMVADVAPCAAESNAMPGEIAPYVAGNSVTSGGIASYVAENGTMVADVAPCVAESNAMIGEIAQRVAGKGTEVAVCGAKSLLTGTETVLENNSTTGEVPEIGNNSTTEDVVPCTVEDDVKPELNLTNTTSQIISKRIKSLFKIGKKAKINSTKTGEIAPYVTEKRIESAKSAAEDSTHLTKTEARTVIIGTKSFWQGTKATAQNIWEGTKTTVRFPVKAAQSLWSGTKFVYKNKNGLGKCYVGITSAIGTGVVINKVAHTEIITKLLDKTAKVYVDTCKVYNVVRHPINSLKAAWRKSFNRAKNPRPQKPIRYVITTC